jgi:predicted aspartyl protease
LLELNGFQIDNRVTWETAGWGWPIFMNGLAYVVCLIVFQIGTHVLHFWRWYNPDVGEIRVKVKLTNATDEANARSGLIDFLAIRSMQVEGVVDTGAVRSVLPPHVVEQLGLQIRPQTVARCADDRSESVGLTEGVLFECLTRETLEEALVLGTEVLIGHTVLEKLDLLADCAGQRLIPHPDRPNQPVSMVR